VTALERRYRRLLQAYPPGYRRERGEEMLGTLLDNTPPDRRWPALREARALLLGGLRVLSGLNQRLTMAANLRLAAVVGLELMLLRLAAADLTFHIVFGRHTHIALPGTGYAVAYDALILAVVAATFFAPRLLAGALAVATAGLWFWGDGNHGQGVLAAVVLVLVAILSRGKERPPRLWLWLVGSLLAVDLLPALGAWGSLYPPGVLLTTLLWVILGGVALWMAVDPRPVITVAVYLACLFAGLPATIVFGVQPPFPWQMFIYAGSAALLAAAAVWRLHSQAV
jgi:hypothetical protein